MIRIYTDGSCKKNPGPGGFGVVVLSEENNVLEYFYNEKCSETTNNREELKAILYAFELAQTKYKNEDCLIYSDSAYCVNICNDWIHSWARNGWKNSKKMTVENVDLIQLLYKYLNIDFFNCQVLKTNGHVGVVGNELADALATFNDKKFKKIVKENNVTTKEMSYIKNKIDLF